MQFGKHIRTAAWSTAGKALSIVLGLTFVLAQKVVGENYFGQYMTVQAFLTAVFLLSDGLSLQAMVNFGMDDARRPETMTITALTHTAFVAACSALLYFGRFQVAALLDKPQLADTLMLFPPWAAAFWLRTYFLKVSQLRIDTRGTFFIEAAWVGVTITLIVAGHARGTLATANDLMVIGIIAAAASSLTGAVLYARHIRFTSALSRRHVRGILAFGFTQLGSAATITLQAYGDVLLLARFVTFGVIGNYSAAKTFYRGYEALRDAGSLFVYPAVARLAAQNRQNEIVPLVEKMMAFMLMVIVPIVLLVWLGPTEMLFNLVYKGKFLQAAGVFRLLSLGAPAIPFAMNIVVLYGLSAARQALYITMTVTLVFFLSGVALVALYGVHGAAVTVALSVAILGALSTRQLKKLLPDFSLRRALTRWRDAADFLKTVFQRGGISK